MKTAYPNTDKLPNSDYINFQWSDYEKKVNISCGNGQLILFPVAANVISVKSEKRF